jgi:hypothetical protein
LEEENRRKDLMLKNDSDSKGKMSEEQIRKLEHDLKLTKDKQA